MAVHHIRVTTINERVFFFFFFVAAYLVEEINVNLNNLNDFVLRLQ